MCSLAVCGCTSSTVLVEAPLEAGTEGGSRADGGDPPIVEAGASDSGTIPTCIPIADPCAGKTCGTAGDGCGTSYACGNCGPNETCGPNDTCTCATMCGGTCCPSGAQECTGNGFTCEVDGGTTICNGGACAVEPYQPCIAAAPCGDGFCSGGICYQCAYGNGPGPDGGCEMNLCVAPQGGTPVTCP